MFEGDYTINGKHATYIKFLVNDAKLFDRYIDVYMNGAIFGLLYNRVSGKDNTSQDRARIYADAFSTCREDCVFLYRLVLLLDENAKISTDERIDRTFRYDADAKDADKLATNMELFNSYALGGVEVLYEKLTDGCATQDDYITKSYELMASFSEEIKGIPYEEKLASLING
jgi:hypothetical protein